MVCRMTKGNAPGQELLGYALLKVLRGCVLHAAIKKTEETVYKRQKLVIDALFNRQPLQFVENWPDVTRPFCLRDILLHLFVCLFVVVAVLGWLSLSNLRNYATIMAPQRNFILVDNFRFAFFQMSSQDSTVSISFLCSVSVGAMYLHCSRLRSAIASCPKLMTAM